jgi:hypothetical protein
MCVWHGGTPFRNQLAESKYKVMSYLRIVLFSCILALSSCADYIMSVKSNSGATANMKFSVPELIDIREDVYFRIMLEELEVFSGPIKSLQRGSLNFTVPDRVITLGKNVMTVEYFVPPTNYSIGNSVIVVDLAPEVEQATRARRFLYGGTIGGAGGLVLGTIFARRWLATHSRSFEQPPVISPVEHMPPFNFSSPPARLPHEVIPYSSFQHSSFSIRDVKTRGKQSIGSELINSKTLLYTAGAIASQQAVRFAYKLLSRPSSQPNIGRSTSKSGLLVVRSMKPLDLSTVLSRIILRVRNFFGIR